jgi:hypothetical protein
MSLINELEAAIPDFDKILEAKFEVLHNCLILSEAKNLNLPAELNSDENYIKAFANFQSEPLNSENLSHKLVILRDILLSNY